MHLIQIKIQIGIPLGYSSIVWQAPSDWQEYEISAKNESFDMPSLQAFRCYGVDEEAEEHHDA